MGASSRDVAPPNLETRVADLVVVLDAVGSERPVLGGALRGRSSERAVRRHVPRTGALPVLVVSGAPDDHGA